VHAVPAASSLAHPSRATADNPCKAALFSPFLCGPSRDVLGRSADLAFGLGAFAFFVGYAGLPLGRGSPPPRAAYRRSWCSRSDRSWCRSVISRSRSPTLHALASSASGVYTGVLIRRRAAVVWHAMALARGRRGIHRTGLPGIATTQAFALVSLTALGALRSRPPRSPTSGLCRTTALCSRRAGGSSQTSSDQTHLACSRIRNENSPTVRLSPWSSEDPLCPNVARRFHERPWSTDVFRRAKKDVTMAMSP